MKCLILLFLLTTSSFASLDFANNPIPKNVNRIVSLMPSITESISEMGDLSKVVGTTDFTNVPSDQLKKIKNIGAFNRIAIETVIELKPDVVIANTDGNDVKTIDRIKSFHIPVVLIDTHSLKNIIRSHEIIAEMLNKQSQDNVQKLKTLLLHPQNKISKTIFIQVGFKPLVTVSAKSYINDLLLLVGMKNIFRDAINSYPTISSEEVISRNPDIILILPMSEHDKNTELSIQHWNQFNSISAVKNKKVFVVKTDLLTKPSFNLIEAHEFLKGLL